MAAGSMGGVYRGHKRSREIRAGFCSVAYSAVLEAFRREKEWPDCVAIFPNQGVMECEKRIDPL